MQKCITDNRSFEKLRYIRQEMNLTVAEMSEKLGISPRAYIAKENGMVDFKLSECLRIAEILQSNPEEIFFIQ